MKEIALKNDTVFQDWLLHWNAFIPALLTAVEWSAGRLGANPAEFVTRMTGVIALVFLVLSLAITPLRKMFGWSWLHRHRKNLGLYAFYYTVAHFCTYVAFDRGFGIASIPGDIIGRPFIGIGMLAFILMIPLAVTSTNAMIKRLGGKRWALLHKLAYIIVVAGVLHYWIIVKSDIRWPLTFAAITAVLLGYRVVDNLRNQKKKA